MQAILTVVVTLFLQLSLIYGMGSVEVTVQKKSACIDGTTYATPGTEGLFSKNGPKFGDACITENKG